MKKCRFSMFYNYFMNVFKGTNKLLLVGQFVIYILAQIINCTLNCKLFYTVLLLYFTC